MNNITDEDVLILMKQSNITKKKAQELLILNDGDLVDSLYMLQTDEFDLEKKKKKKQIEEEEETDNFKVDTSIKKNLEKYREIVDDKDNVYIKNNEKKEKIKEKTNFSIEELYKLKRGKNTFNSIKVL